jgi:hypothetical protein
MDISEGMLGRCRHRLHADGLLAPCRVSFHHLVEDQEEGTPPRLPPSLHASLHLLVCFDVFVHVDLHTQWWYWQQIAQVLAPGGRAFVSTANILSPGKSAAQS